MLVVPKMRSEIRSQTITPISKIYYIHALYIKSRACIHHNGASQMIPSMNWPRHAVALRLSIRAPSSLTLKLSVMIQLHQFAWLYWHTRWLSGSLRFNAQSVMQVLRCFVSGICSLRDRSRITQREGHGSLTVLLGLSPIVRKRWKALIMAYCSYAICSLLHSRVWLYKAVCIILFITLITSWLQLADTHPSDHIIMLQRELESSYIGPSNMAQPTVGLLEDHGQSAVQS